MRSDTRKKWVVLFMMLLWAGAVITGFGVLVAHESRPGSASVVSVTWPFQSTLNLSPDRPTIVLFLHPACPCSRTTVSELREVLRGKSVEVHAVFCGLPNEASKSRKADILRNMVSALPSIKTMEDPDCVLAHQSGVSTSGHCQVYAPSGELLFSGGITIARGHAGENHGRIRINNILNQFHDGFIMPSQGKIDYPVFGCTLY